jgi:glutamine amidotransferase
MVGILDYGMGNLRSVRNAFESLGVSVEMIETPQKIDQVDRIVLPGVGAFTACMANLHSKNFVSALHQSVIEQKKPILGICLGMQVMARQGFEGQPCEGLGWFDAEVRKIVTGHPSLRVPQVGWNEIEFRADSPLFQGLPSKSDVYFVHSYQMHCANPADVEATCEHGEKITAAIRKKNIFATQFHPEKSQDHGLKIIENFLNWTGD